LPLNKNAANKTAKKEKLGTFLVDKNSMTEVNQRVTSPGKHEENGIILWQN